MADGKSINVTGFHAGVITGGGPNATNCIIAADRVSVIQKDAPKINGVIFSVTSITGKSPEEVKIIAGSSRVSIVQQDAPSMAADRFGMVAVTGLEACDVNLVCGSSRISVILAAPIVSVKSERVSVIFEQYPQGVPTYTKENVHQSAQALPVPPVPLIFSTSSSSNVYSQVTIQHDHMPMPKSYEDIFSTARLSLHETIIPVAVSTQQTGNVAMKVLLSSDIRHIQVSMNYLYRMAEKVLVDADVWPMWVSPAKAASTATKALINSNDEWPVSYVPAGSVVEQVLVPADFKGHVGTIKDAQVATKVLVSKNSPMFISMETAPTVTSLALVELTEPEPIGDIEGITSHEMAAIESPYDDIDGIRSSDYLAGASCQIAIDTVYPSMTGMSGGNLSGMPMIVLMESSLPVYTSRTRVKQAGLKWLVDSVYPHPDNVQPMDGAAIEHSLAHKTLMSRFDGLPISATRLADIAFNTIISKDEPTPAEILNTGLFAPMLAHNVATKAEYDSALNALSTLDALLVVETLATKDDSFPDKSTALSFVDAGLLAQNVVEKDNSFPDKGLCQSILYAHSVYEVVSCNDESFLPKWWAFSELENSMAVEVAAVTADDYPSKDVVQSTLQAKLVCKVLACGADYPNKSTSQSMVSSLLIGQVAVSKDTALYGMKGMPIKRRPKVSISLVY